MLNPAQYPDARSGPPRGLLRAVIATCIAAALLAPSTADALIAPTRTLDSSTFIARSTSLRIDTFDADIFQEAGTPSMSEWVLDFEVTVRNVSLERGVFTLAVLDSATFSDETLVWLDGTPATTGAMSPRQDPALVEHTYGHARRLRLELDAGAQTVVRVQMRFMAVIDNLGQIFIELPTHAMGLFVDTITAGALRVHPAGRALGLQSTIGDVVIYDEPGGRFTWRLRDWAPTIPFRVSYVAPWSALLLVAEVESCPDPWRVLRAATGGSIDELRRFVGDFDDATLRFCGNLPDVLHGRVFENARTREQLDAMTLDRYIATAPPVPLYRPNPQFTAAALSDVEAIYARTLRALFQERPSAER